MATRRKAKTTRKATRKPARGKGAARRPSPKAKAGRELQSKFDARVREATRLARELDAQKVAPDEIAARVKAELAGLDADLVEGVLRLAGGSIHVNMEA